MVTVTVMGAGVTTLVLTAVVTVAVVAETLVVAEVAVTETMTVAGDGTEIAQEQKADRSAG